MRLCFSSYAFMTDVCLSGYGVGGRYIGSSGIRNIFEYDERWRFKEHAEDGETHRERALRQKHDNAEYIAVVDACDPLSDPIAASAVIGTTARNLLVDPAFFRHSTQHDQFRCVEAFVRSSSYMFRTRSSV